MIIRTLIVGTALAIALFSLPARSAEQPRLKPVVTVHGGLVTLGDLIDNAGTASGVAVFRAPDLGTAGTVRADRIVAAAASNGILALNTGGIETVSVSRTGRSIDAEEVSGAIASAMVKAGHAVRVEGLDIEIDRFEDPLVIESAATAMLQIDDFNYDQRNGRFAAIFKVADSGIAASGVRVTGHAVEIVEIPVLARPIARGDIISPSDIVIERVPRTTLRADVITNADQLAGMSARRQLREGTPLTDDELMQPILVQRGDMVTIVFRSPGLTLTTRGRAFSGGARGDVVSVFNIQSKRTVEAEITGPGIVTVMPQRMPVAALPTTVR